MQNISHDLKRPLLHMKSTFNEKVIENILSIACSITIASNIQRLENNNLATIWSKTQGSQ